MRNVVFAVAVLILASGCPDSSSGSNPLELWEGRYVSEGLEVELEPSGASYTGTVTKQGEAYPLTAKPKGTDELEGSFTVGEDTFSCTLRMTKQGLDFTTGSSTYTLVEEKAPANPLDSKGDAKGTADPANPLDAGGDPPPVDPKPTPPNPLGGGTDPKPAPPNPLGGGTDPKPAPPNPLGGGGTDPKPAPPNPLGGGGTDPKPAPPNPLGGGGKPAPDPSVAEPTETSVVNPWGSGWREFKHASGISFRHPGNWQTQEIEGGVTLTPPDAAKDPQGNPLEVYLVNADLANGVTDPAGAEAQAFVRQQIDPQFPALKSKGPPQRVELRGRTIGVYAWAGTSPQNGLAIEARLYCTMQGKFAYFLFGLGADDRVAKRSGELEAVVASFGFTAPPKDERLTGYWRYTHSQVSGNFSMVTDYHLQLDADGAARFATQSGGGDGGSSILTKGSGWDKTGTWRTEGKQLVVDWSDGSQLAAPYICDGGSLLLKRSSGKQIYERVR